MSPKQEEQGTTEFCRFPVLHNGQRGQGFVEWSEFGHGKIVEVSEFCAQRNLRLEMFFEVVWAIVLKVYAETETILFGSKEDTFDSVDQLFAVAQDGEVSLREACLNSESRIQYLISKGLIRSEGSANAHAVPFNTCLMFGSWGREKSPGNTAPKVTRRGKNDHDVTFTINTLEKNDCLALRFWNSTLSREQSENVVEVILLVIDCLLSGSDQTVGNLQLLGDRAVSLIKTWNRTSLQYTGWPYLHLVIDRQCTVKPGSQAIYAWDGELTYAELSMHSSKLASHLRTLGVGPGVSIPTCFERSSIAIVVDLAVLKAGGAFVPLDPSLPPGRRDEIIDQICPPFVLTAPDISPLLSTAIRTVVISKDMILHCTNDGFSLDSSSLEEHPAYILFTSGSTGKPKGCVVDHAAFASIAAHGQRLLLNSSSRVFQFASRSFGVSLIEIFCTLATGATVCIPSNEDRANNPWEFINRAEVSWAILTPSVIETMEPSMVRPLRVLAVTGEPMTLSLMNRWQHRLHLVHTLGFTEWSGCGIVNLDMAQLLDPRAIGRTPAANVWLVDPENHHRLAPLGAVGEMVFQGPSLAQGYLGEGNKAGSASFFVNPAWASAFPGYCEDKRLYKTGDLVRYNPDGTLTYLGRKGTQVKIRGQRIELVEVEHHLRTLLPDTRRIVAETITPRGGNHSVLMAFIQCSDEQTTFDHDTTDALTESLFAGTDNNFWNRMREIDEKLRSTLPGYMVPSLYIKVLHVPLTVSRKVNRRELRQDVGRFTYEELEELGAGKRAKAAPATNLERTLQRLFAETLKVHQDRIGADDSFFALGGDSIVAMSLVSRCRENGISATVAKVFEAKTISQLALLLSREEEARKETTIQPLFGLSSAQRLLVAWGPTSGHGYQTCLMTLKKEIPTQQVDEALQNLVENHPMLRARFDQGKNGNWLQRIEGCTERTYRLSTHTINDQGLLVQMLEEDAKEISVSGMVFAASQINVEGSPRQNLCLIAHALVVDEVSWQAIVRHLEGLLGQGQLPLPEHAPFSTWSSSPAAQYLPILNGLKDFSRSETREILQQDRLFDSSITENLLGSCNRAFNTSPQELLLASVAYGFFEAFGQEMEATFLSIEDGRRSEEMLARTVGCFDRITPLLTSPRRGVGISEWVREVKDRRRSALKDRSPVGLDSCEDDLVGFVYDSQSTVTVQKLGPFEDVSISWLTNHNRPCSLPQMACHVTVTVVNGCFQLRVFFDQRKHNLEKISLWMDHCQAIVHEMARILPRRDPQLTLSDLPLMSVSNIELDRWINETLVATGVCRPCDVEDVYPCSLLQRGIEMSQAKDPSRYSVCSVWRLSAPRAYESLKIDNIQLAWNAVVDYHPVLRTVFVPSPEADAAIFQVVLKRVEIDVCVLECNPGRAISTLGKFRSHSFPANKPPHRLTICRDGTEVYCMFEMNHKIVDATAMSILKRDLSLAYAGQLPAGPGPRYSGYISFLQGLQSNDSRQYWMNYLDGVEPCLFPSLVSSEATSHHRLRTVKLRLPRRYLLQSFCATHNVTLANLFQIAWAVVLRYYTGLETVCFGYLAAGRDVPVPEADNTMGPFINMLVCRVAFDAHIALSHLLQQTNAEFIQSLDYQLVSLAEIYHSLNLSGGRLFNTGISHRRVEDEPCLDTKSLAWQEIFRYDPTEFDIALEIEDCRHSVSGSIGYWGSVMSRTAAKHLSATFTSVVSQIVSDCNRPASEIECSTLLDVTKLRRLNENRFTFVDSCVHNIIQRHSRGHPDAPAVCAWDGDLTYLELEQLAARVASYLNAQGVGPEYFVPLLFEKSKWTIVALLGVLKAGGAFVLLDPSYPVDRLSFICNTLRTRLVLCSESQEALARSLLLEMVAVIPRYGIFTTSGTSNLVSPPPPPSVGPNNPVYAAFTSGSTGAPKGVVMEHRSFCSGAHGHGNALGIGSNTRALQFSSYAFDVSIADILTTLMGGGCVCVPSEAERMHDISAAIRRMNVNHANLTPSVIRLLDPGSIPTAATIVSGGEPLSERDIRQWSKSVRLLSVYGLAECSVISTVQSATIASQDPGNIGFPAGCTCWVVDEADHNKLRPIGAVGELLIQGHAVGRGYATDTDMSLGGFLQESPAFAVRFPPEMRLRWYKTGDMVRYAQDGSLTYVGRKDTQVKVRGQRVELAEIDSHVAKYIGSDAEVVTELVKFKGQEEAPKLVSFIHLPASERPEDEIDGSNFLQPSPRTLQLISDCKSQLQRMLPSYMIPSLFVQVGQMPVTAGGKRDRRALREGIIGMDGDILRTLNGNLTMVTPPRCEREKTLQRLFAVTLGIEQDQIGREDHFFRIGGDSLLAMELVGTARRTEGLALTMSDLFANPILSDLADKGTMSERAVLSTTPPFSLMEDLGDQLSIRNQAAHFCQVEKDQIEDVYPCTPLQEGLMAMSAKHPGAYVARFSFELTDGIDLDLLRAAWEATAMAHPILRTRIIQSDKMLQTVIKGELPWSITTDTSDGAGADPMGLGTPLFRLVVTKSLSSTCNRYQQVVTIHHALYDGWSLSLILRLVEKSYLGVTPIPCPFSPFIEGILCLDIDKAQEFWVAEFQDLEATVFPAIPPVGHELSPRSVLHHGMDIPSDYDRQHTLSMMIQLAWSITMAAYTDCNDIITGLLVNGRSFPVQCIEELTGPTIATIPLRIRLQKEKTVGEMLDTLRDNALRRGPFEQTGLQQIQRLGGNCAAACQFQSLLVIQAEQRVGENTLFTHVTGGQLGGSGFTTYPLTLEVEVRKGAVRFQSIFDEGLISNWMMENILHTLAHVLGQVLIKRSCAISELKMFCPRDHAILTGWNRAQPEKFDTCMHDLIDQQCITQPDSPAICAWDGNLTYRELHETSDIFAALLSKRSVGRNTLVPVIFEKSKWVPVAIISVMKAGGAFVLLDASQPQQRLRGICSKLGAPLIVSSAAKKEIASHLADSILVLDDHELNCWRQSMDFSGSFRRPEVYPHDAIYAIFTSGSTGEPKGVVVEHSNYCASAREHSKRLSLSSDSRVLQFASHAFDATVCEMLTTLYVGGCICVPSEHSRTNSLVEAMVNMQVSWAFLTPSMIKLLDDRCLRYLKTLIIGGDAVPPSVVRTWAGKVDLRLAYGPTECAVFCTAKTGVTVNTPSRSCGWGMGVRCWVVDKDNHNNLRPLGAPGELVVEGPLVSRGYLGDVKRTSEVFLDSVDWLRNYPKTSNFRLYKTGDLVHYAPDGSIEFLQRKDNQVKLRGQRIDLGEVEWHVQRTFSGHPLTVAEVIPSSSDAASAFLAAFVYFGPPSEHEGTIGQGSTLFAVPDELHREAARTAEPRLQELLPSYMIPAVFIPLTHVPTSTAGKIDRNLLRQQSLLLRRDDLQRYTADSVDTTQKPRSEIETRLQDVFSRVLDLEQQRIGIQESFFRLGGDSITAMQLTSQCRSVGMYLTVQDVFKAKTIQRLASLVKTTHLPSPQSEDIVGALFDLSPIQNLFFKLNPRGNSHFNQSFLVNVTRPTEETDLERAIAAIVEEHPMLRARFVWSETSGQWKQYITIFSPSSYRMGKRLADNVNDLPAIMNQSQRSLDIIKGPLFSADLITIDEKTRYLFLLAHHLVVDLVSWRIILHDLEALLTLESQLTREPLSFSAWNRLQADHASSELDLSKCLPFIPSPPDHSFWGVDTESNTYDHAGTESFNLDELTTQALLGEANNTFDTQPVELITAAVAYGFSKSFPERGHPCIFSEGHGREVWDPTIDISDTVGWFTTIWPIVIALEPHHQIWEAIRRTKDARRQIPSNGWSYFASRFFNARGKDVYENGWPVEIILNYIGPDRSLEGHDSLLQPFEVESNRRDDISQTITRFGLFEITVTVLGGSLHLEFCYNRAVRHRRLMAQWLRSIEASLRTIAGEGHRQPRAFSLTHFPLLDLSYEQLDRLGGEILARHAVTDITEVEEIFPCSAVQQGILLSELRHSAHYRIRMTWQLQPSSQLATIDLAQLMHAWAQVEKRHSMLRTIFVESASDDDQFNQVVLNCSKSGARIIKGCGVHSPSDIPTEIDRFTAETSSHVKQYQKMGFLVCDSGEVFCILDIDHALVDASSLAILMRDLCLAYDHKLPVESGPSYSDYIRYLQSIPSSIEYWTQYLSSVEPCIFPNLLDKAGQADSKGALQTIQVEVGDFAQVLAFCDSQGVTVFNLFQVAWALVLRCFCEKDTVCFGYLLSDRDIPLEGIHHAVGPYINMLLSRVSLEDDKLVSDVLRQTQDDFIAGLSHQHCSLVEVLHETGRSSQNLYNTIISLQRRQDTTQPVETSLVARNISGEDPTEYDIVLNVGISDKAADMSLKYWTEKLSADQALDIASNLNQALATLVSHPHTCIAELSLLSDSNRRKIMTWNRQRPISMTECVHELFQRSVSEQPEKLAVHSAEQLMSYRDLDEHSTALGIRLVQMGVGVGDSVLICLSKSVWAIVSMLAVLRAGGACVPTDISYPAERIKAIAKATSAKVAIIDDSNSRPLEGLVETTISPAVQLSPLILSSNVTLPAVSPSDIAFVLFTSGSTGVPKGIILDHTCISTSIQSHGPALNVKASSRVLQFSSYAFDVSIYEIFTTLASQGCVCVPSDEQRMNDLSKFICESRVNWAFLTPSSASLFTAKDLSGVQTLVLGGEAVTEDVASQFASTLELMNGYGPAECTICTVASIPPTGWQRGTIGRMCGGRGWIVHPSDPDRLTPIGAVGELLVEGPIVASGYLGDPERTAKAFIKRPLWFTNFDSESPMRFYCTGDLVRYNTDGSFRYIGRKDTQVKVRGQRVELAEVESHLRQCFADVQNVIVQLTSVRAHSSNPILVAFIHDARPRNSSSRGQILLDPDPVFVTNTQKAEERMSRSLPTYMLPSLFMPISHVPLTKTGKTDRRQLCDILSAMTHSELQPYLTYQVKKQPPRSEAELRMRHLFARILKVPETEISRNDNFFQMGGDSLLAMRLVGMARDMMMHFTVGDVFGYPVLCELVAQVNQKEKSLHNAVPPPFSSRQSVDGAVGNTASLESSGTSVPFKLREAVKERAIATYPTLCESNISDMLPTTYLQRAFFLSANYTYLWFKFSGILQQDVLQAACETLVKTHSILRTIFVEEENQVIQVTLDKMQFQVTCKDLDQGITDDQIRQYCAVDAISMASIQRSPVQFTLLKHGSARHTLVMRLCHAQYDGLCMPTIAKDLMGAYYGLPLTPKSDFCSYQRHCFSIRTSAAFSFWRRYLEGSRMTHILDLNNNSVPHGVSGNTRVVSSTVIQATPPLSGFTMAIVTKAAWAFTLQKLCGVSDVVFGQLVNGRSVAMDGIESIIGPCINVSPVRVKFSPHWRVVDLFTSLKELYIDAMPFETIPLQDIVMRSTNWPVSTEFGSIFQHQNVDMSPRVSMGDLECEVRGWAAEIVPHTIQVFTVPRTDGLLIEICGPNRLLSSALAETAVKVLRDALLQFLRYPYQKLDKISLPA